MLCAGASAQEVRRALPVNEPPTPPAVPFDFDQPPPAKPAPKPAAPAPAPAAAPEQGSITYTTPDEVQLNYANSLYSQKLYDVAAPEYEKYLGQYPNAAGREPALFRLGECYRALGNSTAARNAYESLLSYFQSGEFVGPAAYRLADINFREKNYAAALPLFRKATSRVKDPAVALSARFYTARCLENLKLTSEARGIYEEVIAAKGNNPFRDASRFSLAQILSDIGRRADAVKQLDALAAEADKPELRAESLIKAALLRIDLNQGEKAAADLNKALKMPEIGAWKGVAQLGLLRTLFQAGKFEEVVNAYEVQSGEYPAESKAEVLLLAANAYRQLGKHEKARELYSAVTAEFPGTPQAAEADYERLVSLYAAGDPNLIKEIDAYLAAETAAEKRDQVTLLKAEALYKFQQYSAAAPVYASLSSSRLSAALKAEAQFKLGWCYMQARELELASKAFSEFIERNPSHKLLPTALVQRAIAQQQLKNYAAALKDFNEVITRHPKAKERELALQQKALILGQMQENAAMADTFRLLLRDYPKTAAVAQANYWIGWAAFEAKDYKNAIAPLKAAREADGEQFLERATLRILLAHYYLEERDALAKEVDAYTREAPQSKVPDEVLRWLGGQFLHDRNHEVAGKYFAALTQRDSDAVPDDWLNLGRSELEQGKFEDAVGSLRTFLEKAKQPYGQATGHLALGQALLGLRKFDEAQKAADQACSLQPEGKLNALGRTLSGDIAAARGSYPEAAKIYLSISVILDDPEITPRALEKAWQALNRAGDEKQAAKTLNDLQSRYPEYQVKPAKVP
jgi:TolA-binding protein